MAGPARLLADPSLRPREPEPGPTLLLWLCFTLRGCCYRYTFIKSHALHVFYLYASFVGTVVRCRLPRYGT